MSVEELNVDEKKEGGRVNTIVQQAAIEHISGDHGCKACMSRALNHELGNEHVRTDKEIREAAMSIANVSAVFEKLVETLEDQLTEYTKKSRELYDLEIQIEKKRKELAEMEAMKKIENFGGFTKKIYAVATAIGIGIASVSTWIGTIIA